MKSVKPSVKMKKFKLSGLTLEESERCLALKYTEGIKALKIILFLVAGAIGMFFLIWINES